MLACLGMLCTADGGLSRYPLAHAPFHIKLLVAVLLMHAAAVGPVETHPFAFKRDCSGGWRASMLVAIGQLHNMQSLVNEGYHASEEGPAVQRRLLDTQMCGWRQRAWTVGDCRCTTCNMGHWITLR